MAPGIKTGGRKKGTKNKKTLLVEEKLANIGVDPITGLAKLSKKRGITPELKFQCLKELAQYVAPKRKAIEMTGANDAPLKPEMYVTISQD